MLFDIIKHLNEKTDLEFSISEYNPWMINQALSNTKDTVFFANEMNSMYDLPKDMQYAFYLHGVPKAKRFGKWHKAEKDEFVQLLMNKYSVNRRVAESYLRLFDDSSKRQLKEEMDKGGKK